MSKTLIYGFIASIIGIGTSATYFFPVIEKMNSFFQSESSSRKEDVVSTNATVSQETVSATATDLSSSQSDSHIENPSVYMGNDSVDKLLKKKSGYNPNASKILEGEIPTTKSY